LGAAMEPVYDMEMKRPTTNTKTMNFGNLRDISPSFFNEIVILNPPATKQ